MVDVLAEDCGQHLKKNLEEITVYPRRELYSVYRWEKVREQGSNPKIIFEIKALILIFCSIVRGQFEDVQQGEGRGTLVIFPQKGE